MNDELYTPKILVDVIKPFFDEWLRDCGIEKPIVWCPFDKDTSEFVKFFKSYGNRIGVIYSHIDEDGDFFELISDVKFDIAISNPPFSKKLGVFKALDNEEKPWAMVMNMMAINYQEIGEYFVEHPVSLIVPDKKISFDGNTSSFCSGYVCGNNFIKGKKVEFVHCEHNNSGKNFVASSMYDTN